MVLMIIETILRVSVARSPVLVRGCVSAGSLHSSIVMVIHVMVVGIYIMFAGIHIDGIMGIHGKMLQASVGSSSWASVSNGVIVHCVYNVCEGRKARFIN